MKRILPLLLAVALSAGCAASRPESAASQAAPPPAAQPPAPPASTPPPAAEPPAPPPPAAEPDPRPDLMRQSPRFLSRDDVRDGLLRLLNEPGTASPAERLTALFQRTELKVSWSNAVPFLEADLDGDGTAEFVLALPVTDPNRNGAALFVAYRRGDQVAVDRTEPMGEREEMELMKPFLHAAVDLTGSGTPQILWSRPQMIATGPQPYSFFVTAWRPGSFTQLPGEMVITNSVKESVRLSPDGKDLLLTGGSRSALATGNRTDRYRYVDGAFRLVDRRFVRTAGEIVGFGTTGYARFWDGLVAEDVGRLAGAEDGYRDAMDPKTLAHPGSVWRYNSPPLELNADEMERFAGALRTFARFRLGALLLQEGRAPEAEAVLTRDQSPYAGLLAAMRTAPDRAAGCQAGAAWAATNPDFLPALNRGVGHRQWTPEVLCSHITIDDSLALLPGAGKVDPAHIGSRIAAFVAAEQRGEPADSFWEEGAERWSLVGNHRFNLIDYTVTEANEFTAKARLRIGIQPKPGDPLRSVTLFADLVRREGIWRFASVHTTP